MDIEKKIETLRKRNAMLQEENEYLKEQLLQQGKDGNKYAELCDQLEVLRDKWEQEISEIKEQKMKYEVMINNVKKIKELFMEGNSGR